MKNTNRKLIIEQLDKNLSKLQILKAAEAPLRGWIHAVRTSLNMTLAQLGRRMKKTPVAIREIEERERNRTITLKKLAEVGEALDLQLVYGFIPKDSSLQAMIEKRAEKIAREIVMRTTHTMALEDQENRAERLQQAVKERALLLTYQIPKQLWD